MTLHFNSIQRERFVFLFGLIFFFLFSSSINAQTYKIKGVVYDSQTKESLIGVPIIVKDNQGRGVASDEKGDYVLTLPKGNYTLQIEYIGYERKEIEISLTKDIRQEIELKQSAIGLKEIVVSGERADANVSSPQTGVERLEIEKINKLPVLLGERDIIKTIQLTPGVQGAGEGSSGFYVRGGSADQNMILLDNVPLYNASHLMGFF